MQTAKQHYEYLIIGAGPAGLQLGHHFEQENRDYLILEKAETPGAFFARFPRHRKLISINKVYTGCDDPEHNLRYDWNSLLSAHDDLRFTRYSQAYFPPADDFRRYLKDYAETTGVNVRYGAEVRRVSKNGVFAVEMDGGDVLTCDRLVVATGLWKPYRPAIPGIEHAEDYTEMQMDPARMANKRVLIVGKANSAFETADALTGHAALIHLCSPHPVKFAWQSHFVGHLRAVNNNFLDTYQLKSQNAVLDADIERIEQREDGGLLVHVRFSHAMGQRRVAPYDHVITCTGFRFDDTIFDETCKPALCIYDKFPEQTSAYESTNVAGLFFAGTLTQMRDYKKTMSGFVHGFRYNVLALQRILGQKFHDAPWPSREVAVRPEAFAEAILARVNNGSGIFLQPGYLADVLVPPLNGGGARYYEDVPVDYLKEGETASWRHHPTFYTVTLEYGPKHADPFNIPRDPSPEAAPEAAYLHPIIRRYEAGHVTAEHHIHDDLENQWTTPDLVDPFMAFMEADFAALPTVQV